MWQTVCKWETENERKRVSVCHYIILSMGDLLHLSGGDMSLCSLVWWKDHRPLWICKKSQVKSWRTKEVLSIIISIKPLLSRQKTPKLTLISHLFFTLNKTLYCDSLQDKRYIDAFGWSDFTLCCCNIDENHLWKKQNKNTLTSFTPCLIVRERGLLNGRELHLHHLQYVCIKRSNPCMHANIASL